MRGTKWALAKRLRLHGLRRGFSAQKTFEAAQTFVDAFDDMA